MPNVFSATEMLSALSTGQLTPALEILCAIKHEDKNDKHLLINLKMSCDDWIPVPLECIETLEYIRKFTCNDHSHPIVRLTFAKPKTAEGLALAAVAIQQAELNSQTGLQTHDAFEKCANCLNRCSEIYTERGPRLVCYNTCTSCGGGSGGHQQ